MKEFIIGTSGHIDHGKTSLIFALTGTNPDRLAEEKRRGITTDLGFAHLELSRELSAGIIDVPGHEKFINNMLAGAGQIDMVLMVVAANEGVMPQTKEHLEILSLLHITCGVIVLTKCDLVPADEILQRRAEVKQQFADSFLADAAVAEVSVKTGDGLMHLRKLIAETAQCLTQKTSDGSFYMPIDRVFTLDGFGTVVTGVISDGRVAVGSTVELGLSGLTSRVRGIQCYGAERSEAQAGARAALNLSRVKKDELSRGTVLGTEGTLRTVSFLNVRISVLKGTKRVLQNNSRLHLFIGSTSVLCRAVLFKDVPCVEAGKSAYAQLRLEAPIVARTGDYFVLRFYSPLETIGGGVVLELSDMRIKHGDRRTAAALNILEHGTPEQKLRLAFYKNPQIKEARFLLRSLPKKTFDDTLEKLLQSGSLALSANRDFIKKPDSKAVAPVLFKPTKEQLQAAAAIKKAFSTQGYLTLTAVQLSQKTGFTVNACCHAAGYLCDNGVLVKVLPQVYLSAPAYLSALAVLEEALHKDGAITLAHYRDLLKISRKPTQVLLEYFDSMGITKMEGDFRVKA